MTRTTQQPNRSSARRLCAAAVGLAALASLAWSAPAAQAGVLVASAGSCPATPLSQPFMRWADPLSYTPVPHGGFERRATGLSLSQANVVNGNETFYVNEANDSKALSLPPGSSATTPTLCAGLDKPVLRFFSRSSSVLLSSLSVEVLFESSTGQVLSLPVGVVLPSSNWQPTLPLPVLASLLPLLPGSQTPVAFRFRPIGPATWTIDDVYIDPRRH